MQGSPATSSRHERRAEAVLDAAKHIIENQGYTALSMRTISARADMSASTLYFYFRTKEEIFLTLLSRRLDRLAQQAERICAGGDFQTMVCAFATAYREYYREYGQFVNVWALLSDAQALATLPPPLVSRLREQLMHIFSTVSAAVERTLGATAAPLTVPMLWVTMTGLAEVFAGPRARAHVFVWDDMVTFAARTLLNGLAPRDVSSDVSAQ